MRPRSRIRRKRVVIPVATIVAVIVLGSPPPAPLFAQQSKPPTMHAEQLTGAAARAYVAAKRAADPRFEAAQAKAAAEMRQLGWKPTGEVIVYRRTKVQITPSLVSRLRDFFMPRVHADTDSWGNSEGEFIADQWTDGDEATWEGSLWSHNYTHATYGSVNMQFYVGGGQYVPPDNWQTGDNINYQAHPTTWHGGQCNSGEIMEHAIKHALQRASPWCAGYGGACRIAGGWGSPTYWQCLGIGCFATIGAYVLEDLGEWKRVCACGYAGGLSCA